ncbi:MAG: sigma-70 family RNA polymerase sigma factor [Deltaproteobacteria bacterium]|nr:sigma-70 family RNA polymerase sigma factor [Deltaproteobacteria bacterium]
MSASDSDDEALLEAWRAGDKGAGDRLVRRNLAVLYRFFRHRSGDATADLVQRTFLAAVEVRDRVPPGVRFRAYLLGIARNQLLMFQRSSARRGRVMSSGENTGVQGGPTPSGAAAHREEQRLLLRGLRGLPLDMQLSLELFYWEGLSRAEIATVLEVETNTVKSRLQRAKARLRELLVELDPVTGTVTAADLERWAKSLRDASIDSGDR